MLASIRTACAEVARRAQHVRIVGDLAGYVRGLDLGLPRYDLDHHFHGGDPESLAAFIITLDAVNFGSGYFPHLIKQPGMSGYFTVASRLKERFESRGRLSSRQLQELSPMAVAELFGQDLVDPVRAELMRHFTRALNDLGRLLTDRFEGRFTALVESAGGSAERLLGILAEMPLYQDVSRYADLEVPFYKRCQITASDLALAFAGKGLGTFSDLDDLTLFADNLVPHVLRLDGMLEYSRELSLRVERGELLAPGSAEEVEIRAVALHAVEQLSATLRSGGHRVFPRQLDVVLWNRGQGSRYRNLPRHRTRTVYY